jgi:hypothetical protein
MVHVLSRLGEGKKLERGERREARSSFCGVDPVSLLIAADERFLRTRPVGLHASSLGYLLGPQSYLVHVISAPGRSLKTAESPSPSLSGSCVRI